MMLQSDWVKIATLIIVLGLGIIAGVGVLYAQEQVDAIEPVVKSNLFEVEVRTHDGSYVPAPKSFFWVATCNPQKAFTEFKKVKEQRKALTQQRSQLTQAAQARSKIATDKLAELEKEKEGSRKWQKLFEELATIKADNVVWLNLVNSQIATKNSQIIKDGYADVSVAVAKVAKAKGLNLVLSKVDALPGQLSVLYADDALDITDDVIKVLNGEGR